MDAFRQTGLISNDLTFLHPPDNMTCQPRIRLTTVHKITVLLQALSFGPCKLKLPIVWICSMGQAT